MKKSKISLANTKPNSQVFACLVFGKHNIHVEIKKIRQAKLKLWFSDKPIPSKEKSYISQLMNGTASFGEKAARRLEITYNMGEMYLDEIDTNYGIDFSNMSVEKLDFIKKIAVMKEDKFRATTKLYEAAEGVAETIEKSGNDKK